jgi:hypothetical protein
MMSEKVDQAKKRKERKKEIEALLSWESNPGLL